MSYQVFARKYRPLTFDDVLGQDHVVRTLRNAIEQNRLAHAYLFVGPRGTGKTSTARIFAKALNCTGGPRVDFDPNEDICREIAEGRSLDVLEIDGASNRGIDHIRDLRDNVRFAPSRGTFRIVYIDEVHMLTKESFNALLKTLEEPPPHVKFIFATTEPHKILPTILSRCQRFDLRPIPAEIIAEHLLHICDLEHVKLSREAAFAIAKVADGGMRDAQSMLDQLVSFCGNSIEEAQVLNIFGITSRETVATGLALILEKNLPALLRLVQEQAEAGRDMGQLLSEIISTVREVLVSKVDTSASIASIPPELQERISAIVVKTRTDKILRLVEVLSDTEDKMRWSTQKRLHLEMGLIKAVHAMAEASISDIIKAIEGAPIPHTPIEVSSPPSFSATQIPAPAQSQPAPIVPENRDEDSRIPQTPQAIDSQLSPVKPTPEEQTPSIPEQELSAPESNKTEAPEPTRETIPQETIPSSEDTVPEPNLSEGKTDNTPDSQPEEPAEPMPESSSIPEPLSALSSDPVRPPETDPMDEPEEFLQEDTGTECFMNNLFTGEPEPLPAKEETTQPEIEDTSDRNEDEAAWKETIVRLSSTSPLKAGFIQYSAFLSRQGGFYTVGVHPTDSQARDTLQHPSLKEQAETILTELLHCPITLRVEMSSLVPEPPEPEPIPEPEQKPKPKPLPPAPEPPVEAPKPVDEEKQAEDYYKDPFIEKALAIFKARIIS